jgi:hypothetical protein
VIDGHGREAIDYEFALRSRVKKAERAMEAASLKRFGPLLTGGGVGPPER